MGLRRTGLGTSMFLARLVGGLPRARLLKDCIGCIRRQIINRKNNKKNNIKNKNRIQYNKNLINTLTTNN